MRVIASNAMKPKKVSSDAPYHQYDIYLMKERKEYAQKNAWQDHQSHSFSTLNNILFLIYMRAIEAGKESSNMYQ